jgi:hypothetical protein
LSEQEKQDRFPGREPILNETLHKINTILSQDRFKHYFDHLMDDKAHLVSIESYEKSKEVIMEEWDQFSQFGPIEYNKIFNDIDNFILDEKVSEESI